MTHCGMTVKRKGMSGEGVRKMKTLTVKMERASLIGKGRYYMTFFVYEAYEINSKIIFLADVSFFVERHLRFE
jgi:hypothetical protein